MRCRPSSPAFMLRRRADCRSPLPPTSGPFCCGAGRAICWSSAPPPWRTMRARSRSWAAISRHYVNHWHEAAFGGADRLAGTLEIPLFCHESERASMPESVTKVAGTFSGRHVEGDDFEVIPIPGHTSGATAYLWHSGEHRCLFTGDTVYLREGEWVAAVLESSDRSAYIESLELIKGTGFRRARALGGDRRASPSTPSPTSGYPAPHRRDPRARAPRRRSLRTSLSRRRQGEDNAGARFGRPGILATGRGPHPAVGAGQVVLDDRYAPPQALAP